MSLSITALPDDLLIEVVLYLDVESVLVLKQTCRIIHTSLSSDYLWHKLIAGWDMPIDVPPFADIYTLSARELQSAAMKALKLNANWGSENPRIKRLKFITREGRTTPADEMKLLAGAKLLTTIRRIRTPEKVSTIMAIYSLADINKPYQAASFEVDSHVYFYDSSIMDDPDDVVFATTSVEKRIESLTVYRTRVKSELDLVSKSSHDFTTVFRKEIHNNTGLLYKLSVRGEMVAAINANIGGEYQILVANWKTGICHTLTQDLGIHPPGPSHIQLLPNVLVIFTTTVRQRSVFSIPLDPLMVGGDQEATIPPPVYYFKYTDQPHSYPTMMLGGASTNCPPNSRVPPLMVITFNRSGDPQSNQFIRAGLDQQNKLGSYVFRNPHGTYPDICQIGSSGLRAVWIQALSMEDSDDREVMRLHFDPVHDKVSVGVLLPSNPGLPFKPSHCRAMAFDEASGRLCLGFFNGDIWVLDYVYA